MTSSPTTRHDDDEPSVEITAEPRKNDRGFAVAPMLYPKLLRKVADLIEALTAFEFPDPEGQESTHYIGGMHALPVVNDEDGDKLVGWVQQEDIRCWAFVPYVPEIELVGEVRDGE